MPVTEYEDVARIKKELNLLQKLYGLFNTVMDSIDGYFDILWTEVDIEKINSELLDFQNKYAISDIPYLSLFILPLSVFQVPQATQGFKGVAGFQ